MANHYNQRVSVLIVEDAPIYREALEGNLRAREDCFEVIGWADQQEKATKLVKEYVPDIVLLDLVLFRDKQAGIHVIHEVRQISPSTQIVVLTAHFDEDLIFEAIWAGATTYLLKDNVTADRLADILLDVKNGEPPMEAEIAHRLCLLFQALQNGNNQNNKVPKLTDRETEVLGLIAAGMSNQKIAKELVIALKTVKTHVSNILAKLHLNNRTELTMWYHRQQIKKVNK